MLRDAAEAGLYSAAYRIPLVWFTIVTLLAQSRTFEVTTALIAGAPTVAEMIRSTSRRSLPLAICPLLVAPVAGAAIEPLFGAAYKDRKSVVWGKSGSVRVDLGGRRLFKKK